MGVLVDISLSAEEPIKMAVKISQDHNRILQRNGLYWSTMLVMDKVETNPICTH